MNVDIRIDDDLRRLIPPLSEAEYAQLEDNLAKDGCRDPLVAWDGVLLDGHNRYDICGRLGIKYSVRQMILPDRIAARIWIRWNQLGRRNLTDDQRAMQVAGLVEDLTAQSKRERAATAGKIGGVGRAKNSLSDTASEKLLKKPTKDTRRATSKRARVSERKVKQAQTISKRAPELAKQVAAGELSLADAVRKTKPAVRAEKLAEAVWPEGKHGVILADPPWKPDEGLLDPTRRIENQYPTMTLAELIALRPKIDALADTNCVLLMWVTTQKVSEAAALIEGWGFTVKSGAVWVKDTIGMGYWFRGRHELLVLATRGNPMTPLEADRPDSVITAARRGHSEKPDEVYSIIERMFPQVPKVEIFARAQRDGWQHGTNELALRSA